jgi:hypothetical protein
MAKFTLCSILDCGRQTVGKGFCSVHYKRHKRGSDMLAPVKGILTYCTVKGCSRPLLANGVCNAHYIRIKNGKSLDTPIWERKIVCIECGKKINHGGRGRCAYHYRKLLYQERMKKFIDRLGGKCNKCGRVFPNCVYDFHHIRDKSFGISNQLTNRSEKELLEEIDKCVLLCANCHREVHFN